MEGLQSEIEKLLDIIAVLLVKLDAAVENDVVSEMKFILDKSRNEVQLIQQSLLQNIKQEDDINENVDGFDENDFDMKPSDLEEIIKLSKTEEEDLPMKEDNPLEEVDDTSPVKISFKRNYSEVDEDEMDSSEQHLEFDQMFDKIRKCYLCDFIVTSEYNLLTHLREEHSTKYERSCNGFRRQTTLYFQCKKCDYSEISRPGSSYGKTQLHYMKKHTFKQCDECKETFSVEDFPYHNCDFAMFYRVRKCNECDFSDTSKTTMQEHIEKIHNIYSRKGGFHDLLHCKSCQYSTTNFKHMVTKHSQKHVEKTEKQCRYCKKTFPLETFSFHDCDANFKSIRKCKICNMTIYSSTEFEEHLKLVHSEEPEKISFLDKTILHFQCPKCEFTATIRSNMKRHINRFHSLNTETCDICGHISKSKSALSDHIKQKHYAPEGQTKCEKCLKCFPNEEFDGHLCERLKFMCNICGYECLSKGTFKRHIMVEHEKVVIPKTFFCHQCDYSSESSGGLKTHMETHEEKKPCQVCGVKVRNMKAHIDTVHTPDEVKKFQCQDCGKGFSDITKLNKHRMNVHLKLRPYECRYGCNISYNDLSNRNQHEKKNHGKIFTTVKEEKLKARLQ